MTAFTLAPAGNPPWNGPRTSADVMASGSSGSTVQAASRPIPAGGSPMSMTAT